MTPANDSELDEKLKTMLLILASGDPVFGKVYVSAADELVKNIKQLFADDGWAKAPAMTPQPPSEASSKLRENLKDDIELLLKDYLADNLDNWHVKPTPKRIEEYLQFHMPGYTREAFAKLFDKYSEAHTARLLLEAQTNAVAWTVGVIDEFHMMPHEDSAGRDKFYKGVKNGLRDRYRSETGIDPAPHYPVKAQLANSKTGEKK